LLSKDKEEDLYKRDYTAPTLEDHFDKAILPKVMQVKNFGLSGRTKYTHLVDQDTTKFDSPWATDSAQTNQFHSKHAAGMKQEFERPSKKRRG
jgi:microfibrillar-associated protein 1